MYKLPWHWDFPKLLGVARKTDERRRFARQIPRGSQYKIKRLKTNSATSCARKLHGSTHRKNSITKACKKQYKHSELCNIKTWNSIALLQPKFSISTSKTHFQKYTFKPDFFCKEFHNSVANRAKSTKIRDLERELQACYLKSEVDNDTKQKYHEEDDDPRKKNKRRLDLYSKPLEYLPNTQLPEVTTRNFSRIKSQPVSGIHAEENVTSETSLFDSKNFNTQQSETEKHDASANLTTSSETSTRTTLHVEDNKPILNISKLEPKLDEERLKNVDENKSFFDNARKGPELAPDTITDVPWKARKSGLKELKEELKTSLLKPKDGEEKLQKESDDPHNNLKNLDDYPKPTPENPIIAEPSRDLLAEQSYLTRYMKRLGSNINAKSLQTEQNKASQSLPAEESKLDETFDKSNPTVTKSQSDSKIHSGSDLRQSLKNIPRFFYGSQPYEAKSEISQVKSKKTESQPALSDRKWYDVEKGSILSYIKDKLWFWIRSKRPKEEIQTPLLSSGPVRQEKLSDTDTVQVPKYTLQSSTFSKSGTQNLSSTQKSNEAELSESLNSSLPTPVSRIDVSLSSSVPAPESRTVDKSSFVSSETTSLQSPLSESKTQTTHNTQPTISISSKPSQETFDTQHSNVNTPVSHNSYSTQPVTSNHPSQSHVSQTTYNARPTFSQYSQQWQHMNVSQPHQNNQNVYYPQSGFQSTSDQSNYSQNFVPIGNPTMTVPQATWTSSVPWNSSVPNYNVQANAWQNFQAQSYENQFNNQNIRSVGGNKALPTLPSSTSHIVVPPKSHNFGGPGTPTGLTLANLQRLKQTIDTFKGLPSAEQYVTKPAIPQTQNLAAHTPAGEPIFGHFGGQISKSFSSTGVPSMSVSPIPKLGQPLSSARNPYAMPNPPGHMPELPKITKEPSSMPFPPASTLGLPAYYQTNAVNPDINLGSPPASNPYNIPLQTVPSLGQVNASTKNVLNMPPQSIATPAEPPKQSSSMLYTMSPTGLPVPPTPGNVYDNASSVPLPFPFPMSLPVINYYSAPLPPGSSPGPFTAPSPMPGPFTPSPMPGPFTPSHMPGSFSPSPIPGAVAPSPMPGSFTPNPTPGSLAPMDLGSFTTPISRASTSMPIPRPFTTPLTPGSNTSTTTYGPLTPTQSTATFKFTPTPVSASPNPISAPNTPTKTPGSHTATPTSNSCTPFKTCESFKQSGSFTNTPNSGTFTSSSDGTFVPYPQANSFSAPDSPLRLSKDSDQNVDSFKPIKNK